MQSRHSMKASFMRRVLMLMLVLLRQSCDAFHFSNRLIKATPTPEIKPNVFDRHGLVRPRHSILLCSGIVPDESADDDVEPGKMRVSEIKAELDLRNVFYADCFDKESLVQRLTMARKEGVADPSILDQFNKQNLEGIFRDESFQSMIKDMNDSDLNAAMANDGTLPGGLTPDTFKKLIGDPEILASLSSTKMQDAMKLIMTGKVSELEKKMEEDSELRQIVEKLDSTLKANGFTL